MEFTDSVDQEMPRESKQAGRAITYDRMYGRFHVGIRGKILGVGMTTGRPHITLLVLWTVVSDSREKAFLPRGVKTQRTAQGLTKEEKLHWASVGIFLLKKHPREPFGAAIDALVGAIVAPEPPRSVR
jgi:hypothetical protein